MNISAENHLKKLSRLQENITICLKRAEALEEESAVSKAAEIELKTALKTVKTTKKLLDYFENLKKIMMEASGAQDEQFNDLLSRQNWKAALNSLIKLIESEHEILDKDTKEPSKYLRELFDGLIEKRKVAFHEALEKKTRDYIDGLGWPKIVSNEESAEIISRLQELLTYGEAIYILSKEKAGGVQFDHPLSLFNEPIRIRFEYHFDSDRPTNQINRPEWYFENLLTTCRETVGILREFLLPCWRLRDLDDYLRDGIVELAIRKTEANLEKIREENLPRGLFIHHLVEMGKFLTQLQSEFGFISSDGVIERVFVKNDVDGFVEAELERIKAEYESLFDAAEADRENDYWSTDKKNPREPSPLVIKFLSFFHQQTILPYSYLRTSIKLRSKLLQKVQSWCLETFYDRCLFDCSPLHSSEENIIKDVGMINSFEVLCRVLRDDFGESMDYLELSSQPELHEIIGYDPSELAGTCFNRAAEAFRGISDKLSAQVFNFVMEKFLKTASQHANSMIYARPEDPGMSENFRVAVGNLIESLKFIHPLLCDREYRRLFHKLLPEKLAAFLFHGLLSKNYFSEAGAERFSRDLKYLQETLLTCGELFEESALKSALAPVFEAAEILKIKEKDPTAQFDGSRLAKVVKSGRPEDLKRILDLLRCSQLKAEDLSQIFASRRHIQ